MEKLKIISHYPLYKKTNPLYSEHGPTCLDQYRNQKNAIFKYKNTLNLLNGEIYSRAENSKIYYMTHPNNFSGISGPRQPKSIGSFKI